jgi:hypothetical protein
MICKELIEEISGGQKYIPVPGEPTAKIKGLLASAKFNPVENGSSFLLKYPMPC